VVFELLGGGGLGAAASFGPGVSLGGAADVPILLEAPEPLAAAGHEERDEQGDCQDGRERDAAQEKRPLADGLGGLWGHGG
jgi:hypothetical protein